MAIADASDAIIIDLTPMLGFLTLMVLNEIIHSGLDINPTVGLVGGIAAAVLVGSIAFNNIQISRHEREADEFAAQILITAGYGMKPIIQSLKMIEAHNQDVQKRAGTNRDSLLSDSMFRAFSYDATKREEELRKYTQRAPKISKSECIQTVQSSVS